MVKPAHSAIKDANIAMDIDFLTALNVINLKIREYMHQGLLEIAIKISGIFMING